MLDVCTRVGFYVWVRNWTAESISHQFQSCLVKIFNYRLLSCFYYHVCSVEARKESAERSYYVRKCEKKKCKKNNEVDIRCLWTRKALWTLYTVANMFRTKIRKNTLSVYRVEKTRIKPDWQVSWPVETDQISWVKEYKFINIFQQNKFFSRTNFSANNIFGIVRDIRHFSSPEIWSDMRRSSRFPSFERKKSKRK